MSVRFAEPLRDLFRADIGMRPRHLLEIATVLMDVRSMARVVVTESDHERLVQLLAPLGLHTGVPRVVNRVIRVIGEDRFCERVAREPGNGSSESISIIVARDRDAAQAGQHVDDFGQTRNCGESLGYPNCCINAYIAIEQGVDWTERFGDSGGGGTRHLHWSCNALAGLFTDQTLHPDFFPCELGCSRAAALVRRFVQCGLACGLNAEVHAGVRSMRFACLSLSGVVVRLGGASPDYCVTGCEVRSGRDPRWGQLFALPGLRVHPVPGGLRIFREGEEDFRIRGRILDFGEEASR